MSNVRTMVSLAFHTDDISTHTKWQGNGVAAPVKGLSAQLRGSAGHWRGGLYSLGERGPRSSKQLVKSNPAGSPVTADSNYRHRTQGGRRKTAELAI